jgi:hypothetical protein
MMVRKPQVSAGASAPGDPTIRHAFPAAVLLPTAVGCCPSAARRQRHFQSLTSYMPVRACGPITADMAGELQLVACWAP